MTLCDALLSDLVCLLTENAHNLSSFQQGTKYSLHIRRSILLIMLLYVNYFASCDTYCVKNHLYIVYFTCDVVLFEHIV